MQKKTGRKEARGRPEVFKFLGFTHYCSRSKKGHFRVKRKTDRKKFQSKLKDIVQWIKENRHKKVKLLIKELNTKLNGYYRYYGVTDNSEMIGKFAYLVSQALFKWLNRRSQRKSYTYDGFNKMLKYNPLAIPKIYVNIYEKRF